MRGIIRGKKEKKSLGLDGSGLSLELNGQISELQDVIKYGIKILLYIMLNDIMIKLRGVIGS